MPLIEPPGPAPFGAAGVPAVMSAAVGPVGWGAAGGAGGGTAAAGGWRAGGGAGGHVGGRRARRLEAARVHRVDDDRGAVGLVYQVTHRREHTLVTVLPVGVLVEDGDAVGEENDGLVAGKLLQATHDEVERAERADGGERVAELAQALRAVLVLLGHLPTRTRRLSVAA